MRRINYLGWDIGGAHLKMSHINQSGELIASYQWATPVWKGMEILKRALENSRKYWPQDNLLHAVTTTTEVVDIFPDRTTGVCCLNDLLLEIMAEHSLYFYAGEDGFVTSRNVPDYSERIASANWHASASYLAKCLDAGYLIDIGTTTTDIIPFKGGKLLNRGYTDFERLRYGELIYTGVIRTPVMAIVDEIPFKSFTQPIIAEYFASMADVYRLTGEIGRHEDLQETPDGQGKSEYESARRLARMIGCDLDEKKEILETWFQVANYIAEIQLRKIQQAFDQVNSASKISGHAIIVGAGTGQFLARKLAKKSSLHYKDFSDMLVLTGNDSAEMAQCACAFAVAHNLRRSLNT